MQLPDVNIILYAYRTEAERHQGYRAWLVGLVEGAEAYGMSDLALSGFLRVVTNRQIYHPPSELGPAFEFAERLRDQPHCVNVTPGRRHWQIFGDLCRSTGAKGRLVPDAYFAALAIESGSEWITNDRGFARFPGLRWRHPLDA